MKGYKQNMKEFYLNNIENTRIIFKTKSKQNILDAFHSCKSIYQLDPNELLIIDEQLCLLIDLKKWHDIDNPADDFLNVLKVLEKITRPKGLPINTVGASLSGYDLERKQKFNFKDDYVNGKHVLIGQYEDGKQLLYQEQLYLL